MTYSHTALQINPSDLIPRTDYATLRKKLMAPQKRPVLSKKTEEHVKVQTPITGPVERIWTRQHDAHVMAYLEWRGNEPLGYLKLRCREIGVSYEDIIGKSREKSFLYPRQRLIAEISNKYPHLSLPDLGRLFHRDHTTCLHARRKMELNPPEKLPIGYRVETVRSMYEARYTLKDIAKRLGYGRKTVSRYIKHMGWSR